MQMQASHQETNVVQNLCSCRKEMVCSCVECCAENVMALGVITLSIITKKTVEDDIEDDIEDGNLFERLLLNCLLIFATRGSY